MTFNEMSPAPSRTAIDHVLKRNPDNQGLKRLVDTFEVFRWNAEREVHRFTVLSDFYTFDGWRWHYGALRLGGQTRYFARITKDNDDPSETVHEYSMDVFFQLAKGFFIHKETKK